LRIIYIRGGKVKLREFLEYLDSKGDLIKVKREVDCNIELAKVASAFDGQAILFEKVKGYDIPVVINVNSSRELVAEALEVKKEQILKTILSAMEKPKEAEILKKGACQEVVEKHVDLDALPIPKYLPNDGGRYLTCALVIVNDPENGRNMCYHRLMQISKNSFVARIIPRRGTDTALKNAGGELDVAIAVGNATNVMIAAATSIAKDEDELSMANAIEETPLVKCKTVDVEVPADAEFIFEGRIIDEEADEGPFLDLTGTYDIVRKQPVIEIKKITHRKKPYMQALLPGKNEHKILMGMPREPTIYKEVSKVCKCKNVLISPGGCSWLHGIVQIAKQREDDGKRAIEAAFRGHTSMKHCVVVDEDIDIYNPYDVEWAIATRFQAHRDLVIMEKQKGSSLDPSRYEVDDIHYTTKVGVDATIPFDKSKKDFIRTDYETVKKEDYI